MGIWGVDVDVWSRMEEGEVIRANVVECVSDLFFKWISSGGILQNL